MSNLWLPKKHYSMISLNFLLCLRFILLNISFIPLDHPRLLFSLLALSMSFKYLASFSFGLIPPFISTSSSANFYLQWIWVYCSLRLNQWIFQKLKNYLTSSFAPPFTFTKVFFFFLSHLISFLPKVLYTLIKLLQFFWGLWINLHLFSLLAFDLLLLIV